MLELSKFIGGNLENNSYLIFNPQDQESILIDSAFHTTEKIKSIVKKYNLKILYLINTHSHYDHIMENIKLKETFNLKIVIHKLDSIFLENPIWSPPGFFDSPSSHQADILVEEGSSIKFDDAEAKIFHTPGHTSGSICIFFEKENWLFTGDTLFRGSYGRTDLAGGSEIDMRRSLQRICGFAGDTKIFPGHGDETTLKEEVIWIKNFLKL